MTIDQGLERAWIQILYWVRQSFGPVNKRRFSKTASDPLPTAGDAERKVASVLVPPNIWGALRHGGIEPNNIRSDERDAFLESCAVGWAHRVVDELPMLAMDRNRLEARVRLKWISSTPVSNAKNELQFVVMEFERTGDVRKLEYGARDARRVVGAAGEWMATVDVAAMILGNEDPEIVELRANLERDLDDMAQTLTQARPVFEQHGVDVADLFPEEDEQPFETPAVFDQGQGELVYAFGAGCKQCGRKWRTEVTAAEANEWAIVAARSEPTWEYRYESKCPNCSAEYSDAFDMRGLLSAPPRDQRVPDSVVQDSTTITFDHGVDALICDRCQTDNNIEASVCRGCGRRIDWVISAVARMGAIQFGYISPRSTDPPGHPATRG